MAAIIIFGVGIFAGMHIERNYKVQIETAEERKKILTELREFAAQYKKSQPSCSPTGGVTGGAVNDSSLTGRNEILKDSAPPSSQ
jgi:hypothetical protein